MLQQVLQLIIKRAAPNALQLQQQPESVNDKFQNHITLFAVDVIEEVDGVLDDAVAHVAVVAGWFKNETLIILLNSNRLPAMDEIIQGTNLNLNKNQFLNLKISTFFSRSKS